MRFSGLSARRFEGKLNNRGRRFQKSPPKIHLHRLGIITTLYFRFQRLLNLISSHSWSSSNDRFPVLEITLIFLTDYVLSFVFLGNFIMSGEIRNLPLLTYYVADWDLHCCGSHL